MATEVDLSTHLLRKGDEFELLHGIENYHEIIVGGSKRESRSIHKGRYQVQSVNHDTGELLLIHLDSKDKHQHLIKSGGNISIVTEAALLPDGVYGWFWPDPGSGLGLPQYVFEVRSQTFKDLTYPKISSDVMLLRHAIEGNSELRLYRIDPEEAIAASNWIKTDHTQVVGDYLFFMAKYPGPGDSSKEGVIREVDVVYSRLIDTIVVEDALFSVVQILGKQPKFNDWLSDDDLYPVVGKSIDFGREVSTIGDIKLGAFYATPFIEGYDISRYAASAHVDELRRSKGWEHYEEFQQGTLF